MASGNGDGHGRRMDQLAESPTLMALQRLVSLGGWMALFVLAAFLMPRIWDFGANIQQQVTDTAHALDRVTWRLQVNEAHDGRQDTRMDFIDKRFERLDLGRRPSRPLWVPPAERDG